jgi:hypothetical protein
VPRRRPRTPAAPAKAGASEGQIEPAELQQLDRDRALLVNAVADERRAAATITCEFPGGRRVLANAILEPEDGRIIRQLDVLSGDPKGA